MKKYIIVVGVIVLSGLLFLAFNFDFSSKETQKVTLMLDYTPNTNHTGIYVANQLGYYDEENIELDIVQPGETSVEMAVDQGVVDFGISYQENVLMAREEGMDIVSIYAILSHNTSGLMSYSNKGIETPADLENMTYCGWGGPVEMAFVQTLAIQAGIDPNTIEYQIAESGFFNSDPDQCDFFWEFAGWSGIEANQNDIDYNYIPLFDYGIDEYTPVIITSGSFIDQKPELVQDFISATIKGYEYAYSNPVESAEIFSEINPSYDPDFILESQEYISPYYIDQENLKAGYQEKDIWIDFTQFLYNNQIIKTNDFKGAYNNEFVNFYYES